jgi:hypothetical protein
VDINVAWRRRLDDLCVILEGLPRGELENLEERWEQVPESLGGRAFTPEYVAALLFEPMPTIGPQLIVVRRAGSEINSAYFASYTTELDAGIVTDLMYLNSPAAGSKTALNLPFGALLRALESYRVADLVLGARPERLIELRSHPDIISAIVSAVGQSPTVGESEKRLTLPEDSTR